MAHTELDLRERRTIEDMLNAKITLREIAAEIGRHNSAVYRDIKSICDRLNGTSRMCLGCRTPTQALRKELIKLR